MEEIRITTEDIYNKILEGPDGIYAFYYDHLSMDANQIVVVKDHKFVPINVKIDENCRFETDKVLELNMDSDSEYYGTIGFTHGLKILKEHFGLKTYYCNAAHYMFSGRWGRVNKDSYYAKKCDEFYDVIGDEKNEDLDFVINQ